MHKISVDPARKLVAVTLDGFFSLQATEATAVDLHEAIRSLGSMAGRHLTLYDMRTMHIAPGDALDRFERYFIDPQYKAIWAKKVALVTGSALGTMQMRRVQKARSHIRIFSDPDAALEWLLAA